MTESPDQQRREIERIEQQKLAFGTCSVCNTNPNGKYLETCTECSEKQNGKT